VAEKKEVYLTRPSFVGKKVFLRPETPDDAANRELWMTICQPDSMTCWFRPFSTPMDAAENLKKREPKIEEQRFSIVSKSDKVHVGNVLYFKYNPRNRSAEIGLIVDPDKREMGYGKEGVQILVRHLFLFVGLNKVYAETAAFNTPTKKLLESLGFKLDGTLRDQYFYEGEFHAALHYSLLRYEMDW
jgi:RimJ/RimL family protein N-acetyltransferase